MFGPDAAFRDGQREAIEAVVADGSRTLVVQRTGWGKSLVYWIATRVRRDRGHGPTVIVSPLLSLMRNQIEAADRLGLRAVTINSANRDDWAAIEDDLAADRIDVLFVSAQRFANEDFNARLLPGIRRSIGMFVVDEAHCISDWGHEFVPDYRRIGRLLPSLGAAVPVLGTTATANDRVVEDVARQLGDDVSVIRGPLARGHAAPRRDPVARPGGAARMARGAAPRDAGLRDRLLPHGGGHAAGVGLAARAGDRRATVQRGHRAGGARGPGAGPPREPAQGARGHGRARDGLRQAGPRLRRPLPAAGIADRVLPAGGPGRARGRARVRDPALRPRGRRDRRVLPLDGVPAGGPDGRHPAGARGRPTR